MPLSTEVVLGPGDIVLDGDPAPPQKWRGGTAPPEFTHVLSPNGCMDQDGTWYGVGLSPGQIVLHGDPAPLP